MSQTKATLLGDAFSTGASGTIPVGGIILWSGTIANIASLSGWELCDGSNGTPDLRDKFVLGAHSDGVNAGYPNEQPGASGGAATVTLTEAQMPSHNHTTTFDGHKFFPGDGSTNIGYGGPGLYPATVFTMSDAGSDQPHENLPPYYALAYIMRVS